MKILHISTSDKLGGAAIAAYRLHRCFQEKSDFQSRMLVMTKDSVDNEVFKCKQKLRYYIEQILSTICTKISMSCLKSEYLFSVGHIGLENLSDNKHVKWADIILIHWTGGNYTSISTISNVLKTGKQVYLFMHDMNHMTGGCHHSFGCQGYAELCNNCPMIKRKYLKRIAHSCLASKIHSWSKFNNLAFIAPSKWIYKLFEKSALGKSGIPVYNIPNVIDTDVFKPISREYARNILNLPLSKGLICFGSSSGSRNFYKGWDYLIEALKYIDSNQYDIVLFGNYLTEEDKKKITFKVHQLGYLHDDYSLMLMYNSCDIFVIPSLAENYPLTIAESLACGTPVVGFNVGGIPDLVLHNITGYLAEYKSSKDLANGIQECFSKQINRDLIIIRTALGNMEEKSE